MVYPRAAASKRVHHCAPGLVCGICAEFWKRVPSTHRSDEREWSGSQGGRRPGRSWTY